MMLRPFKDIRERNNLVSKFQGPTGIFALFQDTPSLSYLQLRCRNLRKLHSLASNSRNSKLFYTAHRFQSAHDTLRTDVQCERVIAQTRYFGMRAKKGGKCAYRLNRSALQGRLGDTESALDRAMFPYD
ncbi:unnamed protein product [Ixodes persulcatus]